MVPPNATAKALFDACMLDISDLSPGTMVDFGIKTYAHYQAYHSVIRSGEVTLEQLFAANSDGKALTKLVNDCPSNRHPGIVFKTMFD